MPIYIVEVKTEMVVDAPDHVIAAEVAAEHIKEADTGEFTYELGDLITSVDELPGTWTGICLPYGGDGESRLNTLLTE